MYDKLDNIEVTLKPYKFFRIHQSYLVNMNYIKDVTRYQASLFNGIELNISKKYYKKVLEEYIKIKTETCVYREFYSVILDITLNC